jgi:hypothetical protein
LRIGCGVTRISLEKKPLGKKLSAFILPNIDRFDFCFVFWCDFSEAGSRLDWVLAGCRLPDSWEERRAVCEVAACDPVRPACVP